LNELEVIEQHNWTEGSKYIQLIKMNMEESRDEEECRKMLVDVYQLMKPKEQNNHSIKLNKGVRGV
jgi:plasmid maintenance system killer protein